MRLVLQSFARLGWRLMGWLQMLAAAGLYSLAFHLELWFVQLLAGIAFSIAVLAVVDLLPSDEADNG